MYDISANNIKKIRVLSQANSQLNQVNKNKVSKGKKTLQMALNYLLRGRGVLLYVVKGGRWDQICTLF